MAPTPAAEPERPRPARLRLAAAAVMLAWALGSLFSEALQQIALGGAIVLCAFAWKRVEVDRELRPLLWAAGALAFWQAASPFVSLALGNVASLPRAARYGQFADTLAPIALLAVSSLGVPWRALGWTLCLGWIGELAVSLFQSAVRWPLDHLGSWDFSESVARARENFAEPGEPPRYPGVGFHFHRLRFSNAAIATLGPALAVALYGRVRRHKQLWVAGTLVTVIALISPMLAYARSALAAGFLMILIAALVALRARERAIIIALLIAAGAVGYLMSEPWRQRVASLDENFLEGGDRAVSMKLGARLAEEHPLLGVGFGNFKSAAFELPDSMESQIIRENDTLATSAHNYWLTVFAETGLLGLLLALLFHALLARALFARCRRGSLLAFGGLLSWVGYQVISLSHYIPFHSGTQLTFVFVWALCLAWRPREVLGAPE